MIVPEYWAEGRVQHREKGKQVTVRRFGWSDASVDDAQAMANARAQEALQRILAGEKSERREPKVPYNGAQGVPIREEVVSRHGESVITRNSYGARCLNTPNVLFVDVDFEGVTVASLRGCGMQFVLTMALVIAGFAMGWHKGGKGSAVAIFIGAFLVGSIVMWMWRKLTVVVGGGAEAMALRRIKIFAQAHRDWLARLYRTPAGFRVMVVHRTFDPEEPEVQECFAQLGADKLYARMCRNQHCFRARLGPKPWRVGISAHLKPRPGTWPVSPERLPARSAWIEEYERVAAGFAACSWVEDLGNGVMSSEVRPVMELHDRESRALAGLPMA